MHSKILAVFLASFALSGLAAPSRRATTKVPSLSDIQPHSGLAFSGITVFGDSFSDNGQSPGSSWELSNHRVPNNPNYFNDTARRFSNGPVWVEFLAAGLQVPLTDYAIGGATSDTNVFPGTIGGNYTDGPISVPGAVQQVQKWNSSTPSGTDISNELFIILAGANDGLNAAGFDVTATTQVNVTQLALASTDAIQRMVTTLTSRGAKKIFIGVYPDLSRAPIVKEYATAGASSFGPNVKAFSDELRVATTTYYQTLKSATTGVNATLGDFYSLSNAVFQNPALFGYKDIVDACVVGTYPASTLCSTSTTVQNTYLFWYVPAGRALLSL
ncbi:hypothetical protein FRB95_004065 [Tulasnella sp. JGI-2019a]|nr:hypothetical protein FRB95_004065 [Tulasnella sp. JGI-2019a]